MKKIFFAIYFLSLCLPCISQTNHNANLGDVFIRSVRDSKFDLLKPFFPTPEFYKSITGAAKKTDTEIKNNLKQINDRLRQNWQKISDGVKERGYKMDTVQFVEQIIYNPFGRKTEMEGMVVVYKHEGKKWDDLTLIVSRWKEKLFLLEIPNPTRAFTFYDETLKESKNAKAALEIEKPEFKKMLEEKVKQIITLVSESNESEFAQNLVYRGDDVSRKWKTQLNFNDSTERRQSVEFMKRVKRTTENCTDYKTGDIKTDNESEGTWIILPLLCGGKTISFAFLRVGENYLLGDIDSE